VRQTDPEMSLMGVRPGVEEIDRGRGSIRCKSSHSSIKVRMPLGEAPHAPAGEWHILCAIIHTGTVIEKRTLRQSFPCSAQCRRQRRPSKETVIGLQLSSSESPAACEARVHPGEMARRERRRQHMSLRELSRRTGIAASHLSKIERGLANPSVHALYSIADVLRVPVTDLWESPIDSPFRAPKAQVPSLDAALSALAPSVGLFSPVVEPGQRESVRITGVEFQRLTPHDDAIIEFIEAHHEVGAREDEAIRHNGREYGIVIKGSLLAEIGFQRFLLEPGFSIAFDCSTPHRFTNIGEEEAVSVWVVVGRNMVTKTPVPQY
jgi:transcriptional regulator with XRE-family HTH domain